MLSAQSTPTRFQRVCPVCTSEQAAPWLAKGDLHLVRCDRCAMVYANPVAGELADGRFYDQRAAGFYLSPDKLEADYAPVRFARELRIFRRHCPGGAVLDVGCSTGGFLHQLQTRWPGAYTRQGTDVAGAALAYAERRGVAVERRGFLESPWEPAQFDAITFWAVLEHVMEPKRFLHRAAQLLRPGGWCFVLVPNLQSLAVVLLGAQYRYLTPEHVNYFSPLTLKRLAAAERAFGAVALHATHFNPVVIWQDRRSTGEPVADADRIRLLKRTTRWKQSPWLAPVRLGCGAAERVLGRLGMADNLVLVLRKR